MENGVLDKIDLSDGTFDERFALAEILRAKAVKIADKAMAKAEASEGATAVAESDNIKKGVEDLF